MHAYYKNKKLSAHPAAQVFDISALVGWLVTQPSLATNSNTSNFCGCVIGIQQSQFLTLLFVHRNTKIPLIPNPS